MCICPFMITRVSAPRASTVTVILKTVPWKAETFCEQIALVDLL